MFYIYIYIYIYIYPAVISYASLACLYRLSVIIVCPMTYMRSLRLILEKEDLSHASVACNVTD